MAGNGGVSSSRVGGEAISAAAAAAAMGSAEARFVPQERRSRWGVCFGGLSCFGSQKGGKRIVPASRMLDGNASVNRANGAQSATISNQNAAMNLSLIAPPSSPASFTNSALPSTAQSPSCYLSISANSPGGPSSAMYATGPYAHETQLVSPPVFSTYTTEPSTAPLTPPPELAHLTTPSSPDVPFARFLSSSLELKAAGKENGMPYMLPSYSMGGDLQATYSFYPGSPSSSLISPASGTPRTGMTSPFPEQEATAQWGASLSAHDSPHYRNGASKLFGLDSATTRNFMLSPGSSFFCPATSAQFYLDQAQQSYPHNHSGGKSSKEADIYSSSGNRHHKPCKQDVEEIEAYRASFGFSADEIITTQHYVEIADPADDSFSMSPFGNDKPCMKECLGSEPTNGGQKMKTSESTVLDPGSSKAVSSQVSNGVHTETLEPSKAFSGQGHNSQSVGASPLGGGSPANSNEETYSKIPDSHVTKRTLSGQSCSDAEIDYRRARSLRDAHGILAWRNSLP